MIVKEFRLNNEPWSFLLRFIDNPSLCISRFMLSTKFRLSAEPEMQDINLCRYILISSEKYLPFSSYLSGLICRYEGDYSIPKFISLNGDTYLPEAYKEEFNRGSNGECWGNTYIDKMLKFIRVNPNGLKPSL